MEKFLVIDDDLLVRTRLCEFSNARAIRFWSRGDGARGLRIFRSERLIC